MGPFGRFSAIQVAPLVIYGDFKWASVVRAEIDKLCTMLSFSPVLLNPKWDFSTFSSKSHLWRLLGDFQLPK